MAEREDGIVRVELHVSTGYNYPAGGEWKQGATIRLVRLVDGSEQRIDYKNPRHPTDPPCVYRDYEEQKDAAIMEAISEQASLLIVDHDAIDKRVSQVRAERASKTS
jgi:hypothetical protein